MLQDAIERCTDCPSLRPWRKFSPSVYGNPRTGCLLVGEAPGRLSCDNGRRFTGPAGQLIRRALGAVGHPTYRTLEELFYMTDIVKCHPAAGEDGGANRSPRMSERRACSRFLLRELEVLRPHLIVAIGKVAREHVEAAVARGSGFVRPKILAFPHPSPRNQRTIRRCYPSLSAFEQALTAAFRAVIRRVVRIRAAKGSPRRGRHA